MSKRIQPKCLVSLGHGLRACQVFQASCTLSPLQPHLIASYCLTMPMLTFGNQEVLTNNFMPKWIVRGEERLGA